MGLLNKFNLHLPPQSAEDAAFLAANRERDAQEEQARRTALAQHAGQLTLMPADSHAIERATIDPNRQPGSGTEHNLAVLPEAQDPEAS